MKAERLFYDKAVLPDGAIIEMVIWKVPEPVSPEKLVADFLADVRKVRGES